MSDSEILWLERYKANCLIEAVRLPYNLTPNDRLAIVYDALEIAEEVASRSSKVLQKF